MISGLLRLYYFNTSRGIIWLIQAKFPQTNVTTKQSKCQGSLCPLVKMVAGGGSYNEHNKS